VPKPHPYADLFQRLLEGKISPEEAERLIEWLARDDQDQAASSMILEQLKQVVADEQVSDELRMKMEAKLPAILKKADPIRPAKLTWIRYSSVAAAILLLIGAGIYFFAPHHPPAMIPQPATATRDVAPGKQGAILTLADGRTVVLDSLGNGVVATQSGSKVVLNDGQLAYTSEDKNTTTSETSYNTITTPRGRQFQVTLPDGTRVWLNAASSLRYPTAFTEKERKVEMTGEAYFEVARVQSKDGNNTPFLVNINATTQVQVLGTHFNVNAYADEVTCNTTLLEGSVRVVNGNEKVMLRPGQQARTGRTTTTNIIPNANVEKIMSWKNGKFDFQDATLEEVMRQLQRWYDIDIVYEKGVPKIEFIGKMGRDLSLSEVLSGLQMSKVHFRLEEGRKLVVLP
jgi:ferric-dicitrate binding protein FerR (iron transport regulator)